MCLEILLCFLVSEHKKKKAAEREARERKARASATTAVQEHRRNIEAARVAQEKRDRSNAAIPLVVLSTVGDVLKCWLIHGPNQHTNWLRRGPSKIIEIPFSATTQTFKQMMRCWNQFQFSIQKTPLSEESLALWNDVYGKYFRASLANPDVKEFPTISIANFKQCWATHGDAEKHPDPLFMDMMDVWAEHGDAMVAAAAAAAADLVAVSAPVEPHKSEPKMEVLPPVAATAP